MSKNNSVEIDWVLFRLKNQLFAIQSIYVKVMVELSPITLSPSLPKSVRGFTHYEGTPIQIIDMRKRMGINSLSVEIQEFFDLMDARERDHKNWLSALEACIKEEKEFTLATDHRKCKFGQWYYDYLPTVKNNNLEFLLEQFDRPHKIIHGIAVRAFELQRTNKKEEAIQLIESTRNGELKEMIHLFSKVKKIYKESCREILIILNTESIGQSLALLVDEIISVMSLPEKNWKSINGTLIPFLGSTQLFTGIGEFPEISLPVITLDVSSCANLT